MMWYFLFVMFLGAQAIDFYIPMENFNVLPLIGGYATVKDNLYVSGFNGSQAMTRIRNLTSNVTTDLIGNGGVFALGDYNNDGLDDFATGQQGRDLNLYRQESDGSWTNQTNPAIFPDGYTCRHTRSLSWIDFNKDNLLDILCILNGAPNIVQQDNDNPGTFLNLGHQIFPSRPYSVFTFDVMGDDIVLAGSNFTTNLSGVYVLKLNSNTSYDVVVSNITYGYNYTYQDTRGIYWVNSSHVLLMHKRVELWNLDGTLEQVISNEIGAWLYQDILDDSAKDLVLMNNQTFQIWQGPDFIPVTDAFPIEQPLTLDQGAIGFGDNLLVLTGLNNGTPTAQTFLLGCPTGEFFSENTCQICPNFVSEDQRSCLTCPSDQYFDGSSCQSCPAKHYVSPDQLYCLECEPLFYFDGSKCQACQPNQVTSPDGLSCEDCPDNQLATESGCQFCPDGQGLKDGQCQPCSQGETYQDHACQSPSSDSLVGPLVGSLVGGFSALGLLLVICAGCLLLCCCCLATGVICLVVMIAGASLVGISISGSGIAASVVSARMIYKRFHRNIKFEDIKFGKVLGQGSFGIVYSGTYKGQAVAIKQMNVNLRPEALKNFILEAEILSRLHHPNVIRYIGALESESVCYLVMELADRGALKPFEISEEQKVQVLLQVAEAMGYIHVQGVVHRDLSCRNILLMNDYTPKVTDFGMSRILFEGVDDNQTVTTMGPIRWSPPEFFEDQESKKFSKDTDLYMFGMLVYEVMTDLPPYHQYGPTQLHAVVQKIRNGELPSMEGLDEWVVQLITNCCAMDPSRRLSWDEIINTLQSHELVEVPLNEYIPADDLL